jgi:hypothetical protein
MIAPRYTTILLTLTMILGQPGRKAEKKPDKTVEIIRKGGKLQFLEQGKEAARPIPIVVGQTLRWENKDTRPHSLVSKLTVAGKPLFDTGAIPPGQHKDILFDIDLYHRAGGKPANYVPLKYHSRESEKELGELLFLSAARRGGGVR